MDHPNITVSNRLGNSIDHKRVKYQNLMSWLTCTVNLEIFARLLFSQNFAYAKFLKIKSSGNGEIILSFTDIGKSCPRSKVANMSFNAILENKNLVKISEFTVY